MADREHGPGRPSPHSEGALTDAHTEQHLTRYVAAWGVAGMVAAGFCVWWLSQQLAEGTLEVPWRGVLLLFLLAGLADWWPLEAPFGGRSAFSINLHEAAFVVGLVLVPPAVLPLAFAAGTAIALVPKRLGAQKLSFNVSTHLVAATIGAAGVELLGPDVIEPTAPAGLALLAAGGLAAGIVNLASMAGLRKMLLAREGAPVGDRSFLVEAGWGLVVNLSLGTLLAVVWVTAPWALPFAFVPIVLSRLVLAAGVRRLEAESAERQRLERTVAGASEGICLLDAAAEVEFVNPSAAELLGVDASAAVGRCLDDLLATSATDADDPADSDSDADADADAASADAGARTVRSVLHERNIADPRHLWDLHLDDRIVRVEVTALFTGLRRSGAVVVLVDVTEDREDESLRREFLARVSHELRTPLTAIVGFAETLRSQLGRLSVDEQDRYLEVIERNGSHLGGLVDDLLWSARIGAGKVQVSTETVELHELVEAVEVALQPSLEGATFSWDVGDVQVDADPRHLEQVLSNLITNAFSYGRPPVTVRATSDGSQAVVDVIDAGAGVRTSFVPQLFVPFGQASVGDRRESRGLGLGLAIVSSLVEHNGGTITYLRDAGQTVFRVTLPAP